MIAPYFTLQVHSNTATESYQSGFFNCFSIRTQEAHDKFACIYSTILKYRAKPEVPSNGIIYLLMTLRHVFIIQKRHSKTLNAVSFLRDFF